LLDSLVTRHGLAGLYHNDSQIKRLESTMHDYDTGNAGKIIVTVRPWPDAAGAPVPAPCCPPTRRAEAKMDLIHYCAWLYRHWQERTMSCQRTPKPSPAT
jgi:hypothetical protein